MSCQHDEPISWIMTEFQTTRSTIYEMTCSLGVTYEARTRNLQSHNLRLIDFQGISALTGSTLIAELQSGT
jgi:hypothetical protein